MSEICQCCNQIIPQEQEFDEDDFEYNDFCDECGAEYDNHHPRCSESGSSFYLLITEGYD